MGHRLRYRTVFIYFFKNAISTAVKLKTKNGVFWYGKRFSIKNGKRYSQGEKFGGGGLLFSVDVMSKSVEIGYGELF